MERVSEYSGRDIEGKIPFHVMYNRRLSVSDVLSPIHLVEILWEVSVRSGTWVEEARNRI